MTRGGGMGGGGDGVGGGGRRERETTVVRQRKKGAAKNVDAAGWLAGWWAGRLDDQGSNWGRGACRRVDVDRGRDKRDSDERQFPTDNRQKATVVGGWQVWIIRSDRQELVSGFVDNWRDCRVMTTGSTWTRSEAFGNRGS